MCGVFRRDRSEKRFMRRSRASRAAAKAPSVRIASIGSQTNRISEYVDGSIFVSEDLPTRAPMKRTDAHGGVMQLRPRFTIMIAAK